MLSMTHRRPGKEQHPGSASSPRRPTDMICETSPRGMLGRSHIGLPRLFNGRPPPPMEPITCSQSYPRFPSKKHPERVAFPAIGATHLLHSTPPSRLFSPIGATHLLFSTPIWEKRATWAFSLVGTLVRSVAVTCLFRDPSFSAVFPTRRKRLMESRGLRARP